MKKPNGLAPRAAEDAEAMPTLKEFWEALQREKDMPRPPAADSAGGASSGSSGFSGSSGSGGFVGSGASFGSGGFGSFASGGGGYGIGLVVPDEEARQRILSIMRDLCERDAARRKRRTKDAEKGTVS